MAGGRRPESARLWWWWAVRAGKSEPVAWAAQNALATFASLLFLVVAGLRWPLACTTPLLVPVATIMIAPDRTVGGRLFAGGVIVAAFLCGSVLGGCMVSLAFLARGDAEPWMAYLPESWRRVGASPQQAAAAAQQQLRQALARQAVMDLPPAAEEVLADAAAAIKAAVEGAAGTLAVEVPAFGAAFWALLVVLTSAALLLLVLGRAHVASPAEGVQVQVAVTLLGTITAFAVTTQALTLELWWREIVLGFCYACLACFACCIVAGCLLYVKSAHDEVRSSLAALLLAYGRAISRAASQLLEPVAGGAEGVPASLGEQEERLRSRLEEMAAAAAAMATGSLEPKGAGSRQNRWEGGLQGTGEVRRQLARLNRSLGMAVVEPPWPGLCSQPGASVAAYQVVKAEVTLLFAAVAACTAVCGVARPAALRSAGLAELGKEGRAALSGALALTAAAWPTLRWRPVSPAAWAAQRGRLEGVAHGLAEYHSRQLEQAGLDYALAVDLQQVQEVLMLLPTAAQLLHRAEAMESAVAVALDVPAPAALSAVGSEPKGKTTDEELEAPPEPPAAPPPRPLRQRLAPYAANAAVLLALCSSLSTWAVVLRGAAAAARRLPALLTSRSARSAALRDPTNQFCFKLLLGLGLLQLGIVLMMWLLESGAIKGVLRSFGIAVGGLFALGVFSTAPLLNSPYYLAGLLTATLAALSLPAVVAEFRMLLGLVAYTIAGVAACTYVGCCGAPGVTWQAMLGKTLPTCVGAAWSSLLSLAFPRFASNDMLAQEAGALRASWANTRSMYEEVVAAAADGRRAPNLERQPGAVGSIVGQLENVNSQLGSASVDVRLQPLLSLVLRPPPPVVRLVLPRLRVLAATQLASVAMLGRAAWQQADTLADAASSKGVSGKAQPLPVLGAQGCLPPGQYIATCLASAELGTAVKEVLDAHAALVDACAENLERGRQPREVAALRARMEAAAAAAIGARLALHRTYHRRLRPGLLAAATGSTAGLADVVYSAWMCSLGHTMDELLATAATIASAPAQRRDSWLTAWLGAWAATRAQL
eukprot:scaffold12.g8076.t1